MRTLISMSLSGAIVTVILLALKPLTRKRLSQRWQYYVWLLVVLRLLLPLSPTVTVPSGVLPAALTRSTSSVATSVPTSTTPVGTTPGTSLPTGEPTTSTETSPQTLPAATDVGTTWSVSALLLLIWAIGASTVMIYNIVGYVRFKRKVSSAMVRVTDEHLLAILEECRQEVHVRATITLYTSASVTSPILLGVVRPAIVLPDRPLADNDLRYALLHELTHARRQDGLLKWIAAAATSIHWLNPLAYVIQYELNRSCELACDEAVTIRFSPDDRRRYGSLLLAVASMTGAPSPAMFSAMVEDKRNLKERLGVIMSSKKQTKRTTVVSVMSIALIAAIGILAGCTPKVVPVEGPQISMLMKTNAMSFAYDAVPLTWNVGQNTLQSSGTTVLHADNPNGGDWYGDAKLYWLAPSPATPICVVQQWEVKDHLPLMTTKSENDLDIYTPPMGMQYQYDMGAPVGQPFVRWYAGESQSFLTTDGEILMSSSQTTLEETIITVTEKGILQTTVPAPKTLTLTTAVPSGLKQMEVLYGSGNTENGFVLVEASLADAPMNTPDSIWLLRMNSGVGSWVDCGDLSAFGGNIFSDLSPSFARVGSLLYFTHSHSGIGCIDTAAAAPSITVPEKLNALLDNLYSGTPADAVYAVSAELASYGNGLIIEYPDTDWNSIYYAVDASGTIFGSLRADKTSVTSFDAKARQGSSLPLQNAAGSISLPSIDLFQANIF